MPHVHKLIDFVVSAYVTHGNKVLLIDHKKLKSWLPVGGHIELNEDSDQALFREIEEESGLKKKDLQIFGAHKKIKPHGVKFLYAPVYMNLHNIGKTHKHCCFIYFGVSKTDKIKLAEREHNAIKWFTVQELDDKKYKIHPVVKFYCLEALKNTKK